MKNQQLTKQDWWAALVEECHATYDQKTYESKMTIVEMWHMIGTRIIEDIPKFEAMGIEEGKVSALVANHADLGIRSVQRAIQFARKYKSVEKLPGGQYKQSWHKVCNELLPAPREKDEEEQKECSHKFMCIKCKKMME